MPEFWRRYFSDILYTGRHDERCMGIAMKQIRSGESVIDTQLSRGYESGSGFRDAFSRIMSAPPSKSKDLTILKATWLDSPLGPMLAIADDEFLYLLEFASRRGLEREIERLRSRTKSAIIPGRTKPIDSIETELTQYYAGTLNKFKTPLHLLGSPFQQEVWAELQKIPFGETRSYSDIAIGMNRPSSQRAVANANGANQLAIIIPCHRVIQANGEIGGYGGGVSRKQWLLNHEK